MGILWRSRLRLEYLETKLEDRGGLTKILYSLRFSIELGSMQSCDSKLVDFQKGQILSTFFASRSCNQVQGLTKCHSTTAKCGKTGRQRYIQVKWQRHGISSMFRLLECIREAARRKDLITR